MRRLAWQSSSSARRSARRYCEGGATHGVGSAAVLVLAAGFAIAAGFNDGGNLLAAAASSRTISPRSAYFIILVFTCAGPAIAGTGVAQTTGAGIADFHATGITPLIAA
ncbi:MAG TPA: hypothetical protein VFF43_15955, partial [Caldimonas sp.]|nr:hypothetical protein [Caldimonas sp.]